MTGRCRLGGRDEAFAGVAEVEPEVPTGRSDGLERALQRVDEPEEHVE